MCSSSALTAVIMGRIADLETDRPVFGYHGKEALETGSLPKIYPTPLALYKSAKRRPKP